MTISYQEALRATEIFCEVYYVHDNTDNIGLLLSDINCDTFLGGQTADAAAWDDWIDAVSSVTTESEASLTETQAFAAMITFVRAFGLQISSQEIETLLQEILIDKKGFQPKKESWNLWIKCLQQVISERKTKELV